MLEDICNIDIHLVWLDHKCITSDSWKNIILHVQKPPTFVGAEPKPVEAPKPVKQVEEELPPQPVSIKFMIYS